MKKEELNITWLYPDVLNLHGDRGNVMALKKVGEMLNLEVNIKRVDSYSQKIDFDNTDIILINPGEVKVISKMLQEYRKEHQEEDIEEKMEELRKQKENKQKPSSSGVIVKGIDNCLVKLSKCCNPLPGDEIIGYITKGRGVSVHRKDCVNVKDLLSEENRIIDVKWYEEAKENYNVTIEALANDRKGLLVDILNSIKETKANLMGVSTKTTKERIAIMDINIEVENIEELNKVIRNIKKVDSVYEVRR